MEKPQLTDYMNIIYTLFDRYQAKKVAEKGVKQGKPFTFEQKGFIFLFIMLHFRRIFKFKAQHRWLQEHPDIQKWLDWKTVPARTTFSRRYKALYPEIEQFLMFIGQTASDLGAKCANDHLVEDKSLFKAQGNVWHQSDRLAQRIPAKLRNLDTEASWSKSAYHGWVYGYGLHLTCTEDGFPKLIQVETASISESEVISAKEEILLETIRPLTVAADNGYTQARRIRNWAKRGVILLTPAVKWKQGQFAQAYHHFIKRKDNRRRLAKRRTSVEPVFDLVAKVLGCQGKQKQLPVSGLKNVRTCLALGALTVQIAMVVNSIWRLPFRNISHIQAVFS